MTDLNIHNLKILGDEGNPILAIDDFTLKSGTFLALKGISGAGKSTFLHVISGQLAPQCGTVRWGDADMATLSKRQKACFRRDKMGLVFQDFPLFAELSLFENITIAKNYQPKRKAQIEANAKQLMAHFAFDDIKRDSKHYSGGQQQRIGFMRALATDPDIIIADEPTAALDADNAQKVIDFLLQHHGDKTLIVTSHDDKVLARAERVVTLDGGSIIADV